jgi:hypothetical protein
MFLCSLERLKKYLKNSEQRTGGGAASQSIVRLQKSELEAPFGGLVGKKRTYDHDEEGPKH